MLRHLFCFDIIFFTENVKSLFIARNFHLNSCTKIIKKDSNYLHVEFKTKIMGFVDDVEFYFPEEKLIQIRSASRIGRSDFGVNRKRMESIRKELQ